MCLGLSSTTLPAKWCWVDFYSKNSYTGVAHGSAKFHSTHAHCDTSCVERVAPCVAQYTTEHGCLVGLWTVLSDALYVALRLVCVDFVHRPHVRESVPAAAAE